MMRLERCINGYLHGEGRDMVTYELHERTEDKLTNWCYPKGKKDKEAGVIVAYLKAESIKVIKVAEADFEYEVSAEEMNEMVKAINEMIRECGGTDFDDYATEPSHITGYGDFVVRDIADRVNKGDIPESGIAMWY